MLEIALDCEFLEIACNLKIEFVSGFNGVLQKVGNNDLGIA